MTNISLDLSDKIDPQTARLLATIKQTAASLGMPFFVIGATARDLILEFGYAIPTGRRTEDIDLAVMIKGWENYQQLKDALVATGEFTVDPRTKHRLVYQKMLSVDVIPFGPIAAPTGMITWPNQDTSMTVLGFQEIMDHSISVRIREGLEVRVAPLAGLAIMKLIAWKERRGSNPEKDVADLALLLEHYVQAGNTDRLYDERADLLVSEQHDHDRAGARLLGQDMARLMSPQTKAAVLEILQNHADPENNKDQLIIGLSRRFGDDGYEQARTLLECLRRGIEETVPCRDNLSDNEIRGPNFKASTS